ncbi:MAG: hypothetical protein K9K66_17345 [Desulfarculaceae bacterium]|nr:hypothetical protein [Desulfarculaceae bacterium]MCF8071445.1 hypothetical protein [Desulfarculaceae bacterium]MCF8103427.1 hypothetical protein [Desulfarculaceae bacterium]MCF8117832.1 hypothetical protein [Desulfarculaceae bacterium]
MSDKSTPPPDADIIELTEVVEPEGEGSAPAQPQDAVPDELGELDRILAELNAQTPPPPAPEDLDQLMAEMSVPTDQTPPPPPEEPEEPEDEELRNLLAELGVPPAEKQAEGEGTGDPELDELLAQLGRKQASPEDMAAQAQAAEQDAAEAAEAVSEAARQEARRILADEGPELVARLVAEQLQEQLGPLVQREVKNLLKKAMGKTSAASPDGEEVVD